MTKLVKIKNVRTHFMGEVVQFDALVRVNVYAGTSIYSDKPITLADGREFRGLRLDNAIAPRTASDVGRLARRAVKHGQEIVDWTAL